MCFKAASVAGPPLIEPTRLIRVRAVDFEGRHKMNIPLTQPESSTHEHVAEMFLLCELCVLCG